MARDVETILREMRDNPAGVKFNDARKVADHFFGGYGAPRIAGSHHIYKTPWPGDPRINLQKDGPQAKRYQVIQMLEAIERLKAIMTAQATEGTNLSAKKGK